MLRSWFTFTALLALTATLAAAEPTAKDSTKKPDVLFIAVDDLNDWIGILGGHPDAKTPNIDRLGARGLIFEKAYCTAPACNPSRASLLNGVRPSTSGVYHNDQPWREALSNVVSLPKHLQSQGYRVVGGGKIYHGAYPEKDAWNDYFSKSGGQPKPAKLPHNGIAKTSHFDWGPLQEGDDALVDHGVIDWAIRELQAKQDQPLFLAVGLTKPHLPWYVPQKYFDQFPLEKVTLPKIDDNDLADVPPAGVKVAKPDGDHAKVIAAGQYRHAVQAYLAAIAYADAEIGRLLDGLDKSPRKDNTIIVFWGDHGWHLGEKHHWRKFSLWEESARAPLIIVAPNVTKPGTRTARVASFLDIYPTLVDLTGGEKPAHLEGVSLKPVLAEPTIEWKSAAITTHGRNNHAVRTERWRYIRYANGDEELYDHDADPHEWTNLAAKSEFAAIKAELAQRLPATNAADVPTKKGAAQDADAS